MLFSLQLFQIETWVTTDFIHQQGLKLVRDMYDKTGGVGQAYETTVQKYLSETKRIDYPTIYLNINNAYNYTDPDVDYKQLRSNEQNVFFFQSKKKHNGKKVDFTVVISIKLYTQLEGIISLCRTIFVCIVLGIGSIYFSQDANNLVLSPIERMLEKVKFIAKNPLAAANDDIESAGVHSHMAHLEQQKKKKNKPEEVSKDAEYET